MNARVKVRVTSIACPSCGGTGESWLSLRCDWCKGSKRLSAADAEQYADTIYMLAGGGYIAGDHDLDEMREMERKAEAIHAAIGSVPHWRARKGEEA